MTATVLRNVALEKKKRGCFDQLRFFQRLCEVFRTICSSLKCRIDCLFLVAPAAGRESSSDTPPELHHDEWAQAEERYGLYRPFPDETAMLVHRQTT